MTAVAVNDTGGEPASKKSKAPINLQSSIGDTLEILAVSDNGNSLAAFCASANRLIKAAEVLEGLFNEMSYHFPDNNKVEIVARAYVVVYFLEKRFEEIFKGFSQLVEKSKTTTVPSACERGSMDNVPLSEGWTVTPTTKIFTSMIGDKKEEAIAWLKNNGHGDLITETVNASALTSYAMSLLEQDGKELPSDLFKSFDKSSTSVTKRGKRRND